MGEFTYEHLFDVLRRERSREELQELDETFYGLAQDYLAGRVQFARSEDVLSDSAHARTQLQNSRKLLKELYDRREKKIMMLALNTARTGSSLIDTTALLPGERDLFDRIVADLLSARKVILPLSVPAAPPAPIAKAPAAPPKAAAKAAPVPEPSDARKVRITSSIPKFLGADQQTFGPFEPGEEVDLPDRIATVLIKKGRAEEA